MATVGRILLWQSAIGLGCATLAWVLAGPVAGSSALIGACLCLVPNALFALRIVFGLFRGSAKSVLNGFYVAEVFKIAATVMLFILVFRFLSPLRPEFLFAGFLVTQFSMIWAAWVSD